MKSNQNLFRLFLLITDFLLINLATRLAYSMRFREFGFVEDPYISLFLIFNLAWIGASLVNNVYNTEKLFDIRTYTSKLFYILFLQAFIVFAFIFSVKAQYLSRLYLLYAYGFTLGTLLAYRVIVHLIYQYYNSVTYSMRKIIVVGGSPSARDLFDFFESKGTNVYSFLEDVQLDDKNPVAGQDAIRDQVQRLKAFCLDEGINEIYISLPLSYTEIIEELDDFADSNFIYFRLITDLQMANQRKLNVNFFNQIMILSLRKEPLRAMGNRILKRAFDIAFSLAVLLTIFPILYLIVGILIKMESEGPVFFRQLRTGREGKDFLCFKFRTMTVNRDSDAKQATKGDKRITRIGAFLRKTSLDEFPQFINVFLGHMSVVGPRPHMLKHTEEYSKIIDKYLFRHFITPGITGHAQVNGFRGETEDPELMRKRVEYDSWYIENWSLLLDLKIIFFTVWNVVKGEEKAY
jgi:putative colanic acid biosynthesis UDP-glucose lipid carrier transferase